MMLPKALGRTLNRTGNDRVGLSQAPRPIGFGTLAIMKLAIGPPETIETITPIIWRVMI